MLRLEMPTFGAESGGPHKSCAQHAPQRHRQAPGTPSDGPVGWASSESAGAAATEVRASAENMWSRDQEGLCPQEAGAAST